MRWIIGCLVTLLVLVHGERRALNWRHEWRDAVSSSSSLVHILLEGREVFLHIKLFDSSGVDMTHSLYVTGMEPVISEAVRQAPFPGLDLPSMQYIYRHWVVPYRPPKAEVLMMLISRSMPAVFNPIHNSVTDSVFKVRISRDSPFFSSPSMTCASTAEIRSSATLRALFRPLYSPAKSALQYAPVSSSLWVVTTSSNSLILTSDDFSSQCSLPINGEVIPPFKEKNVCGGDSNTGNSVLEAAFVNDEFILSTTAGIILGQYPYKAANWKLLEYNLCFSKMIVDGHPRNDVVFPGTSGSVFLIVKDQVDVYFYSKILSNLHDPLRPYKPSAPSDSELPFKVFKLTSKATSYDMGKSINTTGRVLSAFITYTDIGSSFNFLVETSASQYIIVGYVKSEFKVKFTFPKLVKFQDEYSRYSSVSNYISMDSKDALVLTRIDGVAGGTSEAFFASGNIILSTPDNGNDFYIVKSFKDDMVVQMAHAPRGEYAVLMESGNIWIGHVDFNTNLVQLKTDSSSAYKTLVINFSLTRDLIQVHADTQGENVLFPEVMYSYIDRKTIARSSFKLDYCPYTRYEVMTEPEVAVLRKTRLDTLEYPLDVFLNFIDDYSLTLAVYLKDDIFINNYEMDDLEAQFEIGSVGRNAVTMTKEYRELDHAIVYTFSVLGVSREERVGSSDNFLDQHLISPLKIFPFGKDSFKCISLYENSDIIVGQDVVSQVDSFYPVIPINIVNGCPPHVDIEIPFNTKEALFNSDGSVKFNSAEGCDADNGIPCFCFDNAFSPRLFTKDTLTGELTSYESYFLFWIIAGGRTLDSIREYTPDEQHRFNNGGPNPIYSYDYSYIIFDQNMQPDIFFSDPTRMLLRNISLADNYTVPVYPMNNNISITWMCEYGSPCANLGPSRLGVTPDYYFKVRLTERPMRNDTFCSFKKEFIIRLHNLSLTSPTTFYINAVSIGIWFGIVGIAYLRQAYSPSEISPDTKPSNSKSRKDNKVKAE